MKLYKFRALKQKIDFERLVDILESGKFWCSKFYTMNVSIPTKDATDKGILGGLSVIFLTINDTYCNKTCYNLSILQ